MNRIPIVSLCAGNSSRLGKPKHLLEVNGERLLDRQMRQFPGLVAVTRDMVTGTTCTCDTFIRSQEYWGGGNRSIILLGDVRFSDAAATDILRCRRSLQFWTDTIDIFAITFNAVLGGRIMEAANRVFHDKPIHNEGRLWEMYRKYLRLDNSAGLPPPARTHLRLVDDETQDFDCAEDYELFTSGGSKNWLVQHREVA